MTPSDPAQLPESSQPNTYQIRVKGHLDEWWIDWSDNLTITLEETGNTVLTVPNVDQSALFGLLRRLRDLGLTLISINPAAPEQPGN